MSRHHRCRESPPGGSGPGRRRIHDRPRAGSIRQAEARARPCHAMGEEVRHRWITARCRRACPTRPRPRSSSGSATAGGASAGPSSMTRCARSRVAGCSAGWGRRAGGDRHRLQPVRDARARRAREPGGRRGTGAAASRLHSVVVIRSAVADRLEPRAGGRAAWHRSGRGRRLPTRDRDRRGRPPGRLIAAGIGERDKTRRSGTGALLVRRPWRGRQARMRRLAISPSIWRSAST